MNKFIVSLLICLAAWPLAAQNTMRQRINFTASNQRFEDVMLALAETGRFSFSYNPSLLPVDSIISIDAVDTSVRNILETMLGEEMEVRQQGNHLVILATRYTATDRPVAADKSSFTIRGELTDARSGMKLTGATIFDSKSMQSAVTGDDGSFVMNIPVRHAVIGLSVLTHGVVDTTFVLENDMDRQIRLSVVPSRIKSGSLAGADSINQRAIVKLVSPETGIRRSQGKILSVQRTAQVSFVPFVGTNLKMSGIVANNYSLNILGGYNGATDRMEVGGLVNIDRFYMHGLQVAGLGNAVGQDTRGVQFAGLFNTNLGNVNGVQIAGVTNLVLDSLEGVQIAGVFNVNRGITRGVQFAGVSNIALRDVDGLQMAGVINVSLKNVNKAQFAGVLNFARDVPGGQFAGVFNSSYGQVGGVQLAGVLNTGRTVRSLQLAGVMNVAIDSVNGTQMAAVFNFARKNYGFQLGLFNMGDSAAGLSVGLLNLYLRGYHKLELSTNETLPYSARIKLGANRKFYSLIGLGTQGFDTGSIWGYTFGFGSAFPVGKQKRDRISIDLTATDLQDDDTWFEEWTVMSRLGIFYSLSLGKRFSIFAGPVWSNLYYDPEKTDEFPFIYELIPDRTLYHRSVNEIRMAGWMGFEAGLRFF